MYSFVVDSLQDYYNLPKLSPDNFYYSLSSRLAKELSTQKGRAGNIELPNLMGNSIKLTTSPAGYSLRVNNVPILTKKTTGFKFLEEAIQELAAKEQYGEVHINRPSNRTVYKDREDFNKATREKNQWGSTTSKSYLAKGTVFPKLYQKLLYHNGVKMPTGRDVNKILVFTPALFKSASLREGFKKENYRLIKLPTQSLYVHSSIQKVFDLTDVVVYNGEYSKEITPDLFESQLLDRIDSNLDYWARTTELSSLISWLDEHENSKCVVLIDKTYFILDYNGTKINRKRVSAENQLS